MLGEDLKVSRPQDVPLGQAAGVAPGDRPSASPQALYRALSPKECLTWLCLENGTVLEGSLVNSWAFLKIVIPRNRPCFLCEAQCWCVRRPHLSISEGVSPPRAVRGCESFPTRGVPRSEA